MAQQAGARIDLFGAKFSGRALVPAIRSAARDSGLQIAVDWANSANSKPRYAES
jgi:hypothetical protein